MKQRKPLPGVVRLTFTVPECAAALGVGETTVRKLISSDQVRAIRAEGRVLIPVSAVHEYLEGTRRLEQAS